ncbi:MAG: amidohydrolase [Subtercola sp.]|nr:amidohydrolase [Subtercola sp.]
MTSVLDDLTAVTAPLVALYKDLHEHPELSFHEERTARIVARRLAELGFEVIEKVGATGVVGVLRNGDGPTVLLRADMDALPVLEQTGLDYASTARGLDPAGIEQPVMHACGHDVHSTCLLGAAEVLSSARNTWSGTLEVVFQPAEELGAGAQAMVDDGLFERVPVPDVVLGQHVAPLYAGLLGLHAGPAFAATDAFDVRMFGRGGHGSRPETTIDPIVMAAATILRLQTVVSREVAGGEMAVLTVGQIHAGSKNNIIPDEAAFGVAIRSLDSGVRDRVVAAVRRIINAESAASGAEREPHIVAVDCFPVLVNDIDASARVFGAFKRSFGDQRVIDPGPVTGSEDVSLLATAAGAPLVFWLLGGTDARVYGAAVAAGTVERDIPANHSPFFAPVPQPTLDAGVSALTVAALQWLGAQQ